MPEPTQPEKDEREKDLAEAIRRRFAPFGGVELELPPREAVGPSIEFADDPEEGA